MKPYPQIDELHRLFVFDARTGSLWHSGKGKRADKPNHDGYRRVFVRRESFAAHRVIWAMLTGDYPQDEIDHINGDRSDNRPGNLRLATKSQNAVNRRYPKQKAGNDLPRGVVLHKTGRYQSQICVNRVTRYIGLFSTVEEAKAAYDVAAKKYFGEFASAL